MQRNLIAAIAVAAATLSLAACSSAGAPTATPGAAGGGGTGAAATQAANGGGVGGGAGGGGGASSSDPCSLITQEEASAAIGQSVTAGTNTQDSHECDWFYPTADSLTGGSITIQDGTLSSYCGKPSDPAVGLNIQPVDGVGDPGACFSYVTGTTIGSNLTFSKNGQVFSTAAFLGGGTAIDKVEAVAKALALAALGHL